MGLLSKIGMMEATRLTREGKLQEAVAVLRKIVTGNSPASRHETKSETEEKTQSIIDMLPPSSKTGSAWTAPTAETTAVRFIKTTQLATQKFSGLINGSPEPGFPDWLGRWTGQVEKNDRSHSSTDATFEEYHFANAAGARVYKLYVPSGYNGSSLPLVVMLHGCTQSTDDFAAGTRMNEIAEEQNFIVAYPAQSNAANSSKCWNWFNEIDQQRGKGEASIIAGITTEIMESFSIDTRRVYVAGLSAGGAAAMIMGNTYPDLYAAIGVHSGLPCGAADNVSSAFAAMKHGTNSSKLEQSSGGKIIPTIVFHGDADKTVNCVNGDDIISQAKHGRKWETTISHGQSTGGTKFTRILENDTNGQPVLEQWRLHGAGHAWSGGSPKGSFTDPAGPDASREMIRFFWSQSDRFN